MKKETKTDVWALGHLTCARYFCNHKKTPKKTTKQSLTRASEWIEIWLEKS